MHPSLIAALAGYEVVILDGCDGTGKTTLAEALRDQHGHTLIHSPRTPDGTDIAERYQRILATPGGIVLDRSFISELVYGPLFHGRSRVTDHEAISLARTAASRSGVLVHLTAVPEAIAARLTARDGTAPNSGSIRAILAAYETAFTLLQSAAPVLNADTASPDN